MKIDRAVMCLNSSLLYSGMWDIVAKVYKETTDIIPTLIFCGTQEELDREVKTEHGDVYLFPKYEKFIQRPDLDWTVTWTLFWAIANKFPNDVCCFTGIDEIPISSVLWDKISSISDDKYVVGLGANPYGDIKHIASGHNIAKGSTFKKILQIEDSLELELKRIWDVRYQLSNSNFGWNLEQNNWWGMDEAYISSKLYDHDDVIFMDNRWVSQNLQSKKIDRMYNCSYELDRLKNKDYWTAHLVRPLTDPSKKQIVLNLIKDMGLS
tara:strand:- start:3846 stop:4643 length:798 start_codon:yes stop_codon:yes gene_type:complete